ncbi:MAG TPA: hypothetical protein VHZ02_18165 [Acidimicrobiales bacterium]|jgi:hypothetical protein|nr:hypothetical protein [Acidimicrobiales bacterium]
MQAVNTSACVSALARVVVLVTVGSVVDVDAGSVVVVVVDEAVVLVGEMRGTVAGAFDEGAS